MNRENTLLNYGWRWQVLGLSMMLVTDGGGTKVVLATGRSRPGAAAEIVTRDPVTTTLRPLSDADDVARVIAEASGLLTDGWRLAVSALQSERYGRDMDFRDAVDAMLDTCRRARGEPTLAEREAAKVGAAQ